jgi:peptide/nickel transport system permease protein
VLCASNSGSTVLGTSSTASGWQACSPGDLGTSYSARFDIYQEILRRLGPTTLLAFGSLLLSAPLALILGHLVGHQLEEDRGGIVDVFSQIGIAIPAFWAGLIMVVVFGIRFGWLPTGGYTSPFDDFGVRCVS